MLLLPLDDLLAITREFLNSDVSLSGLSRCLQRHGVGNLNALKPKEIATTSKDYKTNEPGFIHVEVKYLPKMLDELKRRYLWRQSSTCAGCWKSVLPFDVWRAYYHYWADHEVGDPTKPHVTTTWRLESTQRSDSPDMIRPGNTQFWQYSRKSAIKPSLVKVRAWMV